MIFIVFIIKNVILNNRINEGGILFEKIYLYHIDDDIVHTEYFDF